MALDKLEKIQTGNPPAAIPLDVPQKPQAATSFAKQSPPPKANVSAVRDGKADFTNVYLEVRIPVERVSVEQLAEKPSPEEMVNNMTPEFSPNLLGGGHLI